MGMEIFPIAQEKSSGTLNNSDSFPPGPSSSFFLKDKFCLGSVVI